MTGAPRRIGRWLAALPAAALLAASAALAQGGTAGERAGNALWWGDFAELERLHALYRQPGQRDASGKSLVWQFRNGLFETLPGRRDAAETFFVEVEALTLQWTIEHPQSSLAHVLHALALREHAWWYRGTGLANTVPPQVWDDFRKYIRLASEHLARHAEVAFADSSAFAVLVSLGRAGDGNAQQLWAIAQQGLQKNPDDDGLYVTALTGFLPKWGGSAPTVDRFIREVVDRTRAERGMEMYARLYSEAAADQFDHALFSDSGAEWPKMMAGFRDLLARYPDPDNINRFAYFACLAQDKTTLIEQLDRIGSEPRLKQWGRNAARTWESCRRLAGRS